MSNPKEKAEELVGKMCLNDCTDENIERAKQYALIAVNYIIKALRKDLPEIGLGKGYWYSVKQEIEKL
jgi:hypothetical protein